MAAFWPGLSSWLADSRLLTVSSHSGEKVLLSPPFLIKALIPPRGPSL